MRFFLIFLMALPVVAEPHAVLTADLQLISYYEEIDAGLVNQYRADPSKAAKVERHRLLVVPPQPAHTLQQVVDVAGTNINDGGFTVDSTTATRVWVVRNLNPQEIASVNASTAGEVSSDLSRHMRTDHWEEGFLRLNKLQSEALYYLFTLVARGGFHTNLTVPERTRANTVSNELMDIYKLWQTGRTNYYFTLTNTVVVPVPTNYPPLVVDE